MSRALLTEQAEAAFVVAACESTMPKWSASIGTSAVRYVVHDDWLGRRVSIKVSGGIGFVQFGDVTVVADSAAVVAGVPPAWTTDADIVPPIFDGMGEDVFVPPDATHFSVITDTAATRVWITPTDYQTTPDTGYTPHGD